MIERGCCENGCLNKFYRMNKITEHVSVPECKKHYRMYVLNWSEDEATKGKKVKP